jgi:hypothetical protein
MAAMMFRAAAAISRRFADADDLSTAAQLAFAWMLAIAFLVVGALGLGFAVRVFTWAS